MSQPWTTPQPIRPRPSWRQMWGLPIPVRVMLAVLAALIVAAVIVSAVRGPSSSGHVTKAQYDQWRAECEARATETLDTSLYRVGGNRWVDEVNRCLTAKAGD